MSRSVVCDNTPTGCGGEIEIFQMFKYLSKYKLTINYLDIRYTHFLSHTVILN